LQAEMATFAPIFNKCWATAALMPVGPPIAQTLQSRQSCSFGFNASRLTAWVLGVSFLVASARRPGRLNQRCQCLAAQGFELLQIRHYGRSGDAAEMHLFGR